MLKRNVIFSLIMIPLLMFVLVTPASAFVVDEDGTVGANEVIDDDLFLGGDIVTVDGTVNGLLFAGGRDVVLNGKVNGDAILTGQNITVSEGAEITGNLFIGGQIVKVAGKVSGSLFNGSMSLELADTASVTRNLYFGGYSLKTEPKSSVGMDLAIGGYQAILGGDVERDVKAGLGAMQLDGTVGRDLEVSVEAPGKDQPSPMMFMGQPDVPQAINPGLVIAKSAVIGRNLSYTSTVDQSSAIQSQPAGTTVYKTPAPTEDDKKEIDRNTPKAKMDEFFKVGIGKTIVNTARNFITLFLAGALALWLVPGFVKKLVDTIKSKPVPSAGYGFVTYFLGWVAIGIGIMVVIALAIILGLISLGGLGGITFWSGTVLMLAFITGFVFMIGIGSQVVVSYLVGLWVLDKVFHVAEPNKFVALLIGVIIFVILRAIPILGWLIAAVITIFGLGALWIVLNAMRKPATA